MKHRLLTALALAALTCVVVATAASGGGKGRLYQFRGELLGVSTTSVQVQVEGGNRPALRALLGQSQDQSFMVGPTTEILIWRHGIPTVGTVSDLSVGDWMQVNVRSHWGSTLAEIESHPAGIVADHANKPKPPTLPLFLYVGTVAGAQAGGHIALHVTAGNRLALRSLLSQPVDQMFSYSDDTIFLLWQGKVPTVIDASQLKAGDRITVRVRAPRGSTLAQVEATPASHIGDHEPGQPETKSS